MNQIKLPKNVAYIIEELDKAGYEAFAVGGCVRDTLLGKQPGDWDITTSASPWEVKRLFRKTIDTGLQHGTVTVMLNHVGYEVTTYRVDGKYEDGRHPKNVTFTTNLMEDLKRRDFTMNAMAYNEKSGIVDEFNGIIDLEKKIIRCVGNAEERFTEDALRMLRAVRFSAQLGFAIEEQTERAMHKLAYKLETISKERIQVELNKLLVSEHPECICNVYQTGLFLYVLPGTEVFQKEKLQKKIVRMLKSIPKDSILRWAAFLSFCSEKDCYGETILKGLKFDNHTIEYVSKLISYLPKEVEAEERTIRFVLYKMGEELYPLYLVLKKAELEAEKREAEEAEIPFWEEKQKKLEKAELLYQKIIERGDCISLKMLAVTGNDLIDAGIPPGREMGKLLNQLLYRVLEFPEENKRDKLITFAKGSING